MRYVLAILGVILLTVLTVVIIISRPGNESKKQNQNTPKTLVEYANSEARTIFTTQGRVVGKEDRKSIRVTVDRNERVFEVLTGYDGVVEHSEQFGNSTSAFETFLAALDQAGFTKQRSQPTTLDERGACPLGKHFIFELSQGENDISRHWATTCGSRIGTSSAKISLVRSLFEAQIPNYSELASNVKL
ncbi:MAG: hypothetical protein AAB459_00860 [Patescibacteria group bacterium]